MSGDGLVRNLERFIVAAAVRASDTLSDLLNDEIRINRSQLYHGEWRLAPSEHLSERDGLVSVSQTAYGEELMAVSLIVEGKQLRALLDMLTGRHGSLSAPSQEGTELAGIRVDATEIDALRETVNIVTGACATALAGEMNLSRMSSPSLLSHSSGQERGTWLQPNGHSLCAQSCLKARDHPLEFELLMSILCASPARSGAGHANGSSIPMALLPGARRLAALRPRS